MVLISSSTPPMSPYLSSITSSTHICCPNYHDLKGTQLWRSRRQLRSITASQLCTPLTVDKSLLHVSETVSEAGLWAAACLRVRSFYEFNSSSFGVEVSVDSVQLIAFPLLIWLFIYFDCICFSIAGDHKRYLAEREFEALKERVSGKRVGFRRVSCINATLPLSQISSFSEELCTTCKFSVNGEERVVVGTLDLNQCLRLPDEITGMKPKGIGADFARGYLSNVCVAREVYRNGLGYALITKSKMVAQEWGLSDLYVHVAVDNEAAHKLYTKSGFIYENREPAWQARFLDRPPRILLWISPGLPHTHL